MPYESTEQDIAWIERERERIYSDGIALPVWYGEAWFSDNWAIWQYHFPHVSKVDRTMLAYTESPEKGRRDIQTRVRPGRYLQRYFSGILTAKQIAMYAQWQTTGTRECAYTSERDYPLAFADTPDDIARVYVNGPQSCMDGRNFNDADSHPCRVYGAGDLAIAYLTERNTDRVKARSLVWPARKVVGRVYPTPYCFSADGFTSEADSQDCANALWNRLAALGYRQDNGTDFDGANLAKINGRHVYWMPYLDHSYGVNDKGENWSMARYDADYCCDRTDGTLTEREEEEEEREYDWTCDHCGDGYFDDDESASEVYTRYRNGNARVMEYWCDSCCNNHTWYCEAIEERFSDAVESVHVNGMGMVCEDWASDNCFYSDNSEEWYSHDDETPVEVTINEDSDTETWTLSEAQDDGFKCRVTGQWYVTKLVHPNYENVWQGVTLEALTQWLTDNDSETIADSRQLTLAA